MTEEDIKNRVVLPFLNDLGFESKNLKFEGNIKLILGKNKKEPMKDYIINGRYDILVKNNDYNFMLFEIKTEKHSITNDDIKQGLSYARALSDPVPFTLITNGEETKIFRSYDGVEIKKEDLSTNYEVSIEESIKYRFEALKNIICYSKNNINNFLNSFNEDELKRLYNNKFIPDLYIERKEIVNEFEKFLHDNKKVFMIKGKSGIGKTNAICGLYNKFKEKVFGIFYNSCYIKNSILETIKDDFGMYFTENISKKQILDRLSNLGKETKRIFVIYIDAIDELKTNYITLEFDELIKGIQQYDNIKLCLTCKEENVEEMKSVNGVESRLKEEDTTEVELEDLGYEEKSILIEKYSKYYNCYVSEVAKNKILEIKNPFIVKVIFLSYAGNSIPEDFEKEKVLDTYLRLICINNSLDYLELKKVLRTVGNSFCENCNNNNCVDEFELSCQIANQNTNISLKKLYLSGILEKYELDDGVFVGFYYNIMGYYIINVIAKNIKNIKNDKLLKTLNEISHSEFGKSSLIWYAENIGFRDEEADIIYKFNKDIANKKLLEYRCIVNNKFPNIRDKFECNTDIDNVGIALFDAGKIPTIFSFAFFKKEKSDEDIIKIGHFNDENERMRFFFKKRIFSITVIGKLDINKIIIQRIKKMIEESKLCENSCKNILEERIVNLTFILSGLLKKSKKEYVNYVIPKYEKILPINLTTLKNEILELVEEKDNLEFHSLSDINYKNNTNVANFLNYINLYKNEFGNIIDNIPWKYPNQYIDKIKSTTINSKIIEAFGIEGIREYVKDIYVKYINEYRKMVENNFFSIIKNIHFYDEIKDGIYAKIFIIKRKEEVWGNRYGCVLSVGHNKTYKRDDIDVIYEEDRTENEIFMETVKSREYIFSKNFSLDDFFIIGHENYRIKDNELGNGNKYCIIKNLVYSQLIEDFKNIKENILN